MARAGRLAEALALALTASGIAWLCVIWARMAVSPAPQEMREAAPLLSTLAFLAGQNPYAVATLPGPANLYGPLYPLVAVPAAWVLGPTLIAMRATTAACLLGASLILHRACRAEGGGRTLSLLLTAQVLAGWLYWVGPTTRPDALGLLLMLAGCAAFARAPFRWPNFLALLAAALLGFAAKIYFVFPAFVAAAWVFWRGRHALGIAYGLAASLGLAATILGLATLFPGWAAVVLGANIGAAIYDPHHLLRQAGDWTVFSLPLLAGLAAVAPAAWAALRRPRTIGFWAFAALAGLSALLLRLGGHDGAHMTYFFHLLSPFAAVALAAAAGEAPLPRRAVACAFPLALLLNAHWFPWQVQRFAAAEAGFAAAARLIEAARSPLATTEFAPLLLAAGRPAPETGHSEYFAGVLAAAPPSWLAPLLPPRAVLEARAAALAAPIETGLAARAFDLVLTNPFGFGLMPRPLLEANYAPAGRLAVEMPWAAQAWEAEIWRPRPP